MIFTFSAIHFCLAVCLLHPQPLKGEDVEAKRKTSPESILTFFFFFYHAPASGDLLAVLTGSAGGESRSFFSASFKMSSGIAAPLGPAAGQQLPG